MPGNIVQWLWTGVIIGIVAGTLHTLTWLFSRERTTIKFRTHFCEDGGFLSGWLNLLYDQFVFPSSEVSQILFGILFLLAFPLMVIRNALNALTKSALRELDVAKRELLSHDDDPADSKDEPVSPRNAALVLAFLLFGGCLVFAVLNVRILEMGLPLIFPVDRKAVSFIWFGASITLTGVQLLAWTFMLVQWMLALAHREFGNPKSRVVRPSKMVAYMCLLALIVFGACEATLTVVRTYQMRATYLHEAAVGSWWSLPLWVVGVVGFLLPVIAALSAELGFKFLPLLLYVCIGTVTGLLGLPFSLVVGLIALVAALLLSVLGLFGLPAKLIWQATHREPSAQAESRGTEPQGQRPTRPTRGRTRNTHTRDKEVKKHDEPLVPLDDDSPPDTGSRL